MASTSTTTLVTNSMTNLKDGAFVEGGEDTRRVTKTTVREKLIRLKEIITIEPILACYLIADVVCSPALNNLQLEMACRANSGFNETVCGAVVTATHLEKNFTEQNSQVQQFISDMLSWSIPVQSVVPVLLLLFLGSYSDRHKLRKPFLLLPVFGEIIRTSLYIVCTLFQHKWPVAAVGVANTLASFFGSTPMITMTAYAYIADVSTQEMRIVRISAIQICLSVSVPIALTFSGALFDAIGYIPSFLVVILLDSMAFLYGVFLVKEPKRAIEVTSLKGLIGDVVNPQHVMETVKLVTHAKGLQRVNVVFILVIVYISATVAGGEDYVFFYFVQHAYGWDYSYYTIFLAIWWVLNAIGLGVGVLLFTKVFHLDDLIIIAISYFGKVVANVIFITVKSSYGLYIGLIASILQDAGGAGIRSLSTKYVSENDIGKSQSLLAIIEAIAFAAAAEIYHLGIYTYTRDTHITAFFYVGIVLFSFGIAILVWKYLSERNQAPKEETEMNKQKSDAPVVSSVLSATY